ncbi:MULTISPECIES: nickel-dependent lactate racemase [unclassified Paenibacillus]|uniref:nickel-dependent lactate racemase n=1 Tax=unclassified Paenibacillus TaxID=185978 RepID=UPI003643737D
MEEILIYPIPYGNTTLQLCLPEKQHPDVISYHRNIKDLNNDASVKKTRDALSKPIGTPQLHELAVGKRNAVILISDGTRLCPSYIMLPPILQELRAGGILDDEIDIIIALGLHRKHTKEEMRQLVGEEVFSRIRVHNHSSSDEDCIRLGITSAGTPIEINRLAVQADLRIVMGNIEPHAMAGISGGVKALVPGIASQACIEHNHSLSMRFQTQAGCMDNPIHRDMEEALKFIGIDFLLNVVVDHNRHVIGATAGHVIDAHKAGAALAKEHFLVKVNKTYDVVVVSPGGHPKDLQLYQAIKSLRNAASITKLGGTILLIAECSEMFGNGIFQYWIETMKSREHMVSKLKQQFVLGAHKVLHLDEVLSKHRIYLYSSLPRPIVGLLGLEPVDDLQSTYNQITEPKTEYIPEIAIMPYGSLTYPV